MMGKTEVIAMDKIKILVVDDEARMRKLVRELSGKRRIPGA